MLNAVEAALPADIFIGVAAVGDWRVAQTSPTKLKKTPQQKMSLMLVENPDILAAVGQRASGRPSLVVGFAAESENLAENARAKLAAKNCDMIVGNDVSEPSGALGGETNTVVILTKAGKESWLCMTKQEVARRLVTRLADMLPGAGK
jgi:phosphopantothenoylcysteine decarboxylase/phosphopantothenate--cysteine ligase